jgi:hypothetical protein
MDLARYIGLLDRGLFFARADSFPDIWEGSWGGRDLARFRESLADHSQDSIEEIWKKVNEKRRRELAGIGITCWHEADQESAALWDLYLPRSLGVAVRTTTARLCSSVVRDGRSIDLIRLTYTDYASLEIGPDAARALSFKRVEFNHEAEIRGLIQFGSDEMQAMDLFRAAFQSRRTRPVLPGPPRPFIEPLGGYASNDSSLERRVAPDGVHLHTDIKELIEKVVLAPGVSYPTRRAVVSVTEAFGLSRALIAESSVGRVPFDHLRFVDDS